MKVSIFIVSCGKHFTWLEYALKSIEKFARGFHEVMVVIPNNEPWGEVSDVINSYHGPVPLRVFSDEEWPNKGMLWHEWMILNAETICKDAEYILHTDSDCVFTEPVSPEDYFVEGKPVLMYARYEWCCQRFNNPNFMHWKTAVENALGGVSEFEFMRRHPAVHLRDVYTLTRDLIFRNTGKTPQDYIIGCREEYPQGFAEFPTLGEVAWRHFHGRYHWHNQETTPRPKDKLMQLWSHASIETAKEIWVDDKYVLVKPTDVFRKLGLM
jgi:hypothetical protein